MKSAYSLFAVVFVCAFAHAEPIVPSRFDFRATIAFPGYAGGDAVLTDFPALVKLSAETISGFDPAACAAGGADIRFADADGNVLDHEIDTWDPDGESLVWVRLPELSGADTSVTLYWGAGNDAELPAVSASGVWSRYVSVWHVNAGLEDSAADGNDLTIVGGGTVGNGSVVGSGCTQTGGAQAVLTQKPLTNATGTARSVFTLSGWFRPSTSYSSRNGRLFSTKPSGTDAYKKNGFEVILSSNRLLMRGDGSSATYTYATAWADNFAVGRWTHVAAVYNGTSARSFFDGVEKGGGGTIATVTSAEYVMGIGNTGNGSPKDDNTFIGTMDELRLFDGVPSAEWIRAEHDTVADHAGFTSYGPAAAIAVSPRVSVQIADGNTSATLSGTVTILGSDSAAMSPADSCDVYLAWAPLGSDLPAATRIATGVSLQGTFSYAFPGLALDTDYAFVCYATNNVGVGLRNPVDGKFSTCRDRTMRIAATNLVDDAIASLELAFGGNLNGTNTLFAVYGIGDHGSDVARWANVERVAVVYPEDDTFVYTMPDSWGRTVCGLRFILVNGRLPDYDYPLETLGVGGAAYAVTDVVPTGTTVLETKVRLNSTSSNATLYCARGGSTTTSTLSCFFITNSGGSGWRRDYFDAMGDVSGPYGTVNAYTVRNDYTGCYVDGELVASGGRIVPVDFAAGGPMQLFASYVGAPGMGLGNYANLDFYYLTTTDGGVLTHEFVPCVLDHEACLYDTVSRTVIRASGGTFSEGARTTRFDLAAGDVADAPVAAVSPLVECVVPGLGTTLFIVL